MLKANQLAQQMIDFQKFSFLSCYDAATAVQNQATSAMDLMLNQAAWVPSEGRQAISAWIDTCQRERDRFKAYVEKSYANLGMYFTDKPTAAPTKTKKPATPKTKKAVAAQPKKAAPAESKQAAPVEPKKAAPEKSAPAEVKKVAPVETKKAAPVEPRTTKTVSAKKTSAAKKQSKKVLK